MTMRRVPLLVLCGVLAVAGCAGPRAATPTGGAPLSAHLPTPPSTTPTGARPSPAPSASPTSSPILSPTLSPTSTPSRTPATHPTPPATPTVSTRKGVSVWTFDGVDRALKLSGASWYYTWSTTHSAITSPPGVAFVPMIWGPGSVTATALAQAKSAGGSLLGFNEPDLASQSNMTVTQALDLWPKLEATGLRLGSPAVAWGGADAGGWLDSFMSGAASRGYRVDFITLHWYGSDFRAAPATAQLKSYLQAVWARYHKPIWLTEYALIKFASGGSQYPTGAQQAAFVTASTAMLDGLPWLARYAWFALPATPGSGTGLFAPGAIATEAGRAYQKAR